MILEKAKGHHRKIWDPAGTRTHDLPNASRMLLPLSYWTHGRGAETRPHIAALVRGHSRLQPLSLTETTQPRRWRSPADGVAGLGGLTVQTHCLSRHSHCLPPQPLAQLPPYTSSSIIQWTSDAECPNPRAHNQDIIHRSM